MGYKKYSLFLMVCLAGCSMATAGQKGAYEQGYRAGAKEEMRSVAAQFQGGNFPYYHWSAPIVQDVGVPAHISNGVFIPEHKELVIIKPGEWAQSPSYPIASSKEAYAPQTHHVDMDTVDITHLPNGNGASGGDQPAGKSADPAAGVAAK